MHAKGVNTYVLFCPTGVQHDAFTNKVNARKLRQWQESNVKVILVYFSAADLHCTNGACRRSGRPLSHVHYRNYQLIHDAHQPQSKPRQGGRFQLSCLRFTPAEHLHCSLCLMLLKLPPADLTLIQFQCQEVISTASCCLVFGDCHIESVTSEGNGACLLCMDPGGPVCSSCQTLWMLALICPGSDCREETLMA